MLYLIGLLIGVLLWGLAIVWFIVAVIMIVTNYPFPFNMGFWGFIFPIGELEPTFLDVAVRSRQQQGYSHF